MMERLNAAKWLGVISSAAVLILWLGIVLSKQTQYNPQAAAPGTWVIGDWIIDIVDVKMILLAVLGILAALVKRPMLIMLVFLFLFYPVGLYTLGVPGWAKLVGIATLLFVSSGFLMLASRYKITKI